MGRGRTERYVVTMTDHLEVSRTIAASPEAVYDAISDVTRMGEWSPECVKCEWLDGATAAAVGAKFEGTNQNNGNEWVIQNEVTAADRGARFAFDCSARDFLFASWAYEFESTDDGGCVVTEIWDDYRPEEIRNKPSAISGVTDRAEFNRQSMATTLERLAAAVEG